MLNTSQGVSGNAAAKPAAGTPAAMLGSALFSANASSIAAEPAPLSPLALHEHLLREPVSLAELRAALPKGALELSPGRGVAAVGASFGIAALGEWMLAHTGSLTLSVDLVWRLALLGIGWLIVGCGITRLFIIGHDCGHRAFSRRVWVNDLVGHICMAPILSSYHGWRIGHLHHHAHTLLRHEDIDWAERMITYDEYQRASWLRRVLTRAFFGSPIALIGGFLLGLFRRTFMDLYPQVSQNAGVRRDLQVSRIALFTVSGSIIFALGWFGGAAAVFKYYLIPIEVGMIFGAWVTYFHHNGEDAIIYGAESWDRARGQVVSTFDLRYPAWLERLFLYTNFHRVHHIAPTVPYYRMLEATQALAAAFPAMHQERRFSFGYMIRALRLPLFTQVSDGVFLQNVRADGTQVNSPSR